MFKKAIVCLMLCSFMYLGGCAAGSATAIYSLGAKTAETAEGLTAGAEERLVEKIKREIRLWHNSLKHPDNK